MKFYKQQSSGRLRKEMKKSKKKDTVKNRWTCVEIFMYACVCVCVRGLSSSSSCRTGSTDIPDPLSPLLPIVHRPR